MIRSAERHDHLAAAPAASAPVPQAVDMTSFVGREGLLGKAERLVAATGLVTLRATTADLVMQPASPPPVMIGTDGVSKLRLLARLAREFTDGASTPGFKRGVVLARLGNIKISDEGLETAMTAFVVGRENGW